MKKSLILLSITLIGLLSVGELKAQTKQDTLIREYYKAFDEGDFDKVVNYFNIEAKITIPFTHGPIGVASYKEMAMDFKNGFPDIKHTIIESFAIKNDYGFKAMMAGTNTGVINGNMPTGNKIEVPFIGIIRFDINGKITNMTIHMNTKSYFDQLMK